MTEIKKDPSIRAMINGHKNDDDGMVSINDIVARYNTDVNHKCDVPVSVIMAIRSMLEYGKNEYDRCKEFINNYEIIEKFIDDADEF